MPKPSQKGPEYSQEREWAVILEDLRGQFKVFGEGLQDVRHRLERVEEKLDSIDRDVSVIKLSLPPLFRKVADHEKRLGGLESVR